MRKIDLQNNNNLTGKYPLFFGQALGLFDTFNQPYPELETLSDEQQALFWPAKEISLVQDAVDIQNCDPDTLNLLIENLSFQMAGDSVAAGTISGLFLPIISNNQAVELIEYHSMTESIHAKAYLRIIAECFKDPNQLLQRIKANEKILRRLDVVLQVFRDHNNMLKGYMYEDLYQRDPSACRRQVIKTCVALLCLEAIMFLSSFANTFALTETTQQFNGTSKLVGLIHDDESISHKKNMLAFLNIMINKEKYPEWEQVKPECKLLLDTVVKQEVAWGKDLFKVCKPLIGYNATLLEEYVYFLSRPLYNALKVDYDFPVIESNPFGGWISKYTKADMVQVAAQESEVSNYLTSLATDDTADEEFDF